MAPQKYDLQPMQYDLQPYDLQPYQAPVSNQEPSLWQRANTPLVNLRDNKYMQNQEFTKEHPYIGGALNGMMDIMSSMSSPLSLGLGATSLGANVAGRVGLPAAAKLLHIPGKAASMGMMGHGLYNLYNEESGPGKLGGLFEAGLGSLGMRGLEKAPLVEGAELPVSSLDKSRLTPPTFEKAPAIRGEGGKFQPYKFNPDAVFGGADVADPTSFRNVGMNAPDTMYGLLENRLRPPTGEPVLGGSRLGRLASDETGAIGNLKNNKKITLYRWQSEPGSGVPDWVKNDPKYQSSQNASGGWFTDDPNTLEFYKQDSGGKGKVVTMQVSPEQAEKFRVANNPEALKFSADPKTEYFIPQESRLGRLASDETGAARIKSGGPLIIEPPSGSAKLASSIRALTTKGKLPTTKVEDFQLGQADVDALAGEIKNAQHLTEAEKINSQTALTKVLAGEVPDKSEINTLRRAFGDEFTLSIRDLDKADIKARRQLVSQVVNVPRTIMASHDLSAPMRQGLGLIHRKEYWNSFGTMFKAFGSEKSYNAAKQYVESLPTHKLAVNSGLALTDLVELSKKEEAFLSSKFIQKIPVVGDVLSPGINASERAYTAFLNKLRADTYQSLVKDAMRAGMNPAENEVLAKSIAKYVNNATGRGSLGAWEHSAVGLNSVFFSPRLIASRLQMMNPNNYIRLGQEYGIGSPEASFIRQQYIKSVLGMAAFGGTLTSLAKLNGADVESDSRSTDFGKIKIGNTRIDPWGGFQQYGVLMSQLLHGEQKSSESGQITQFGSSPVVPTRLGKVTQFAVKKGNPLLTFAGSWLNGKDLISGKPFELGPQAAKMALPLIVQDVKQLLESDPSMAEYLGIPAATFGMGTQTYGP